VGPIESVVTAAPASAAPQATTTATPRSLVRLFPAAPAVRVGWRAPVLALVLIAAGVVVSLARQPGAGALDTVWAEDGSIFLGDAVRRSWLDALTTSYAGYFHLVPRLLAWSATAVQPGAAASVLAAEAAACVAAVAVLVYVASAGHLTSRVARMVVAGIVVLLPLAQAEVLNSIANLHWYGLYALFWLLLWTPAGRTGRIVALVAVLLVAGSDILVAAYVPLALARLAVRRERHSLMLAVALGIGLLAQIVGLATGESSRDLSPNPKDWLTGYLVRVVPDTMLGGRWFAAKQVDMHWLALAGVAWILVALVLGAAWLAAVRLWTRPNQPLAGAAAVHSVLLYALPVTLSGAAIPRYGAAPAMLLVTAFVALVQPARAGDGSPSRFWLGMRASAVPLAGYVALLAVVCALNLRVTNERAEGPSWRDGMSAARVWCASPDQGATARVAVSPVTDPPTWWADLPCSYVRHS
jgi:hypothetical protein